MKKIDEKYISDLKKICRAGIRSDENDFHYYIDRVIFKAKKLSDALNHIRASITNNSTLTSNQHVKKIEELCEIELQNLLHEVGKINYDIYEEEQKLKILKPKYDKSNKTKYIDFRAEYLEVNRSIASLKVNDLKLKQYIEIIVDYFMTDYHMRKEDLVDSISLDLRK
jgi:hypothetical protein